jgi:hypothetical protein
MHNPGRNCRLAGTTPDQHRMPTVHARGRTIASGSCIPARDALSSIAKQAESGARNGGVPMILRTCILVPAMAALVSAVTVGQIDTFQDGTTMGWFVGSFDHPNPPHNFPTGGPAGAGDAYLRLTASGGSGAGSRLAVLNEGQWAGDYTAAGITQIKMDVNNFGPDDLHLRLLFEDLDGPGPPVNLALSANAIILPAGSGWTSVVFPVLPGDLVLETFGTVAGALANTDTLRIFHNPNPTFPGPGAGIPPVNAVLGVDNITAAIPEPGAVLFVAPSLGVLLALRCRRVWRTSVACSARLLNGNAGAICSQT